MKFEKIDTPPAGTWARDCELLCLSDCRGFKISYHRDEDDTYWSLQCSRIVAYKVINEEFSRTEYLLNLPTDGAFFEILDSPWIREFGREQDRILDKCKHYVLRFYDETIEIIAQDFVFEQVKENDNKRLEEKNVQTKHDFVNFLRDLNRNYLANLSSWENRDIGTFLVAMASWMEDMDSHYISRGLSVPEKPDWKVFADILMGGKLYE